MEVFGIRLVGLNEVNAQKLLMTCAFIVVILILKAMAKFLLRLYTKRRDNRRFQFWARQTINLVSAFIIVTTVLSIWFNDPTRLATGLGLVTAGLAFALQKVVTSLAGYLLIMRGNTFNVGDRITMGGIRGDVVALGFLQTTIMEMGQPPSVQGANPAMWVKSRQFTGRIVTVTNDKIFEEPVYNYTREFPYIWEEISIPIKYTADRKKVEQILIDSTARHTKDIFQMSSNQRSVLEKRFGVNFDDVLPRVFYRLTDNWLELNVRFLVKDHAIRNKIDAINRDILEAFEAANIDIASATFEVVGLPAVKVADTQSRQALDQSQ
jgi:small-conductance mechanosensitive channel